MNQNSDCNTYQIVTNLKFRQNFNGHKTDIATKLKLKQNLHYWANSNFDKAKFVRNFKLLQIYDCDKIKLWKTKIVAKQDSDIALVMTKFKFKY